MAGRKIRSAEEAHACLAATEEAGVGLAVWARQHGIDGRSLNAWRMNLARRGGAVKPASLRLVELVTPSTRSAAPIHVRCGAFEVVVDADFDDDVLGRLLRVVAQC